MSYVGERLFDELKDSDIEVEYVIDQKVINIYSEVEVYSPNDNLEEVDAIIVTPVFFFDEIKERVSEKVNYPIISLEDILYDMKLCKQKIMQMKTNYRDIELMKREADVLYRLTKKV